MGLTTRLIAHRDRPGVRRLVKEVLAVHGIDFPASVVVGRDFALMHRGGGTVVHPGVRFGDGVTVFHQVTIGMADAFTPIPETEWPLIHVGDRVLLGAGAKVLAPRTGLTIGAGTRVGANAVLLESTGKDEVWVGVPARRVS